MKSIPVLLTTFFSTTVFSQSLVPDINFGTAGKLAVNYGTDAPTFNSCIALLPQDKMIIGGNTIVRVSSIGLPDASFNKTGFYFDPALNASPKSITVKDGVVTAMYADYAADTAIILKKLDTSGTPDSSYGSNGALVYGLPGIKLSGYKNILQTDGKMLVIGSAAEGVNTNIFVARLLQNGLPDTSFNHTGYHIISLADGTAYANAGVVQSGGGIVLTGLYTNTNSSETQLVVIRIKPGGSLDNSFNTTGTFLTNGLGVGGLSSSVITAQPDDKLLIAGSSNAQIMLIRLKANGSADSSFNDTGILFTYIGQFNNPSGIFVRPNGKIVVSVETAISADDPSSWNYGALQLLEDGKPDNSFSADGKMFISISVVDHCVGAVLQSDGRLILTGYANEASLITMIGVDTVGEVDYNFGNGGIRILQLLGTSDDLISVLERSDKKLIAVGAKNTGVLDKSKIVLVRIKAGGIGLDSSFGFNGKTGVSRDNTTVYDAGLQQSGKILLSGTYFDAGISQYRSVVFRFTQDGFTDYSFAPATNFSFLSDPILNTVSAKKMLVQDDDKIIVAQNEAGASPYISVVRLNMDGDPDNLFGVNGKKLLELPGTNYSFNSLALQHDKKILIAAHEQIDDHNTGFVILRLTKDGELDNSFDGDGIMKLPFTSYIFTDDNNIAIAVQPDDKIVIGTTLLTYNTATESNDTSLVFARLKSDGTIDSSFNKIGLLNKYPATGESDLLQSMVAHPDSSIYLTANRYNSLPGQQAFLMKLSGDGKIDSTITADGTGVLLIEHSNRGYAREIKVLQDSTLLAAGTVFNDYTDNDFSFPAYKTRSVTVYKFNGDGDWTDAANWDNNNIPPAILPPGGFIFIEPKPGGSAVLNIDQQMLQGSCIVVVAGKNLIVTGNLTIH